MGSLRELDDWKRPAERPKKQRWSGNQVSTGDKPAKALAPGGDKPNAASRSRTRRRAARREQKRKNIPTRRRRRQTLKKAKARKTKAEKARKSSTAWSCEIQYTGPLGEPGMAAQQQQLAALGKLGQPAMARRQLGQPAIFKPLDGVAGMASQSVEGRSSRRRRLVVGQPHQVRTGRVSGPGERRGLQREGKPVPAHLQPRATTMTKSQNWQRKWLQQLNVLEEKLEESRKGKSWQRNRSSRSS